MATRFRYALLLMTFGFLVESALPPAVVGQFNNALFAQREDEDEQLSSIFVPAPLELKRHLTVAKRALDEQRYSEAVIQLGELLAGGETATGEVAQDYFIGRAGQSGTQLSLKEEALRLIGSMPPKGRDLYELQFGAEARALLEEGIQSGNIDKLTQVARRYFHTKAGYDATYLMGRYELDLDRPLAAALCFQRIREYSPEANRFEPELSVLLATCWSRAGMSDKARESLDELRRQAASGAIVIAGERRQLLGANDEALAWLDKINGVRTQVRTDSAVQWVMYRGDASRTAISDGGVPLLNSRWHLPTSNDPADERIIQQISRDYLDRGVAALPALQPLVVSDYVLMRTPRRLIGVDFRSGKRVWEWPHSNDLSHQPPDGRSYSSSTNGPQRRNELNQRVWEDAPYGQMSSDGRSVFFIDELGTANVNTRSARVIAFGGFRPDQNFPNSSNTLVGLDLARQGYLKWRVGGESGLDEPKLAGAFFLGAPLPLMNRVYALTEINGEIRLVVLDADSGRLQWTQQLAYVDVRTILVDQTRRLAGASPSFADGVLICPTSAGAIVAIDVTTRSLRWGFTYKTNQPVINQFGFQPNSQNKEAEFGDRWIDSTATIANGRVILTPVESDQLFCLDLLTGESVWESKPRGELLYVACVHEGQVVLVGKREITSVRLADGSPAWKNVVRLPDDDMPSGRGFYSDGHYYLPTTGSRLLKVDLNVGRIVDSVQTDSVLGNLVCYGDEVVSQGPQFVKTYYQADSLRDRVAKRLAEYPNDVWALTRQGELHLQAGEQTEALAFLRRAHEADEADLGLHKDEIESLLIRTMLAALREDFAENQSIAADLSDLIGYPDHYAEYLRLTAEGYKAIGQPDKSFDAFLKLVELDQSSETGLDTSSEDYERSERYVAARRDRWVQANLLDLFVSADEKSREMMARRLDDALHRALAAEGAAELRRFVKYFGALPMGGQARFALAERLAESGSTLEAELLLTPAMQSDDSSVAAQATAKIADLLVKADRPRDAVAYYQELARRWPDVKLADGAIGSEVAKRALADPTLQASVHKPQTWPTGRVDVDESGNAATRFSGNRLFPVRLDQVDGFGVSNMDVSVDQQRNLVLRDADGDQISQIAISANQRFFNYNLAQGRANGHLLIISMGYEIAAIDVLRAATEPNYAMLWRKDLTETVVSNNVSQQIRAQTKHTPWGTSHTYPVDGQNNVIGALGPVTSTGVYYQRYRELVCADPMTGEKIWSRNNIEPGSLVFGDEQRIFIYPTQGTEGLELSAVDGRTIRQIALDRGNEPWTTNGSRVLTYSESGNRLHLRLFDMAADRELWTYDFPADSRGDLIGNDAVAVVEPAGRIRIFPLADGPPIVDHRFSPETSLESVSVKRFVDQYIVALKRPIQYDARISVNVIGSSSEVPMINGPVFAFDRRTGKPQWQSPAVIEQFGLPLDQPSDSPVLVFVRQLRTNPQNGNRNNYVSMLVLDRRDGRVLTSTDEIPGAIAGYDIRVDHRQKKVTLNLQIRTYTFSFTDEPTPPSPPATAGDLSHLLAESPLDHFRQQAEAVIDNVRALPAFRRIPLPVAK